MRREAGSADRVLNLEEVLADGVGEGGSPRELGGVVRVSDAEAFQRFSRLDFALVYKKNCKLAVLTATLASSRVWLNLTFAHPARFGGLRLIAHHQFTTAYFRNYPSSLSLAQSNNKTELCSSSVIMIACHLLLKGPDGDPVSAYGENYFACITWPIIPAPFSKIKGLRA